MAFAAFEQALAAAVDRKAIAGAVALVTDRTGVTYQCVAGRRVLDGEVPMDADTVFWIASMTKAIVSVAALQLVDQGRLTLDGDLGELLPDLRDLQVMDGALPDGTPRLRPAKRPVTLRHLLTHTSGFGYAWIDTPIADWMKATGAPDVVSGLRSAHRQPLLFDPGERWAYSIGIDWAGIAVEAASGQRLDAYLADHIFRPLGMVDTGFVSIADRAAGMHTRLGDDGLAAIPFGLAADPEVLSGGGGLHSTAGDYGRFLRFLLSDGTVDGAVILSPAMMAEMKRVQTGDLRAGTWTSAAPHLSRDVDLFPQMLTGWGLATLVNPEVSPHGRQAGSLAWAGLANTYYWADPTSEVAGLLLTQVLPFADPVVLDLFNALERDAYAPG